MKDEIKEINIKFPGQILDYVDTKEHLLELFNYITNLQKENEIVHKDFNELSEKYFFTKSRNEKAIEYVNNHQLVFELSSKKQIQYWFDMFYTDLLNILNGGDDNE